MDFYESTDLRFNSLELGGITSWHSYIYAGYYAADLIGP